MKGENITVIGLFLFGIGILILLSWVIRYDRESHTVLDEKPAPNNNTSKALLTSGTVITTIGYGMCIAGYAIATDFLNFSLKMPKNKLIEI